ncbi:Lipase [Drechslerella dactyloides]|uniref:Lipase n=1 Tax=Drechslerella dactyloides TaxID=74499 RepID=A0AAD6IWU6_DREDA|nr:Lipase [Drechslerella dactyloides]
MPAAGSVYGLESSDSESEPDDYYSKPKSRGDDIYAKFQKLAGEKAPPTDDPDAQAKEFKTAAAEFFKSNMQTLDGQSRDLPAEILHKMAKEVLSKKSDPKMRAWYREFLSQILKKYPGALNHTSKDKNGPKLTPLQTAFKNTNGSFLMQVFTVRKSGGLKELESYFEFQPESGTKENCFHFAATLHVKYLEKMVKVYKNSTKAFAAQDADGNTPLHLATIAACTADQPEQQQNDFERVKIFVQKFPRALLTKNNSREHNAQHTPYQARIAELRQQAKTTGQIPKADKVTSPMAVVVDENALYAKDEVAAYIRDYCITEFDNRDDVITALYQIGEERHIEFDLISLPHKTISTSYLKSLSGHLKFENVLRYVALPQLSVKDDIDLFKIAKTEETKRLIALEKRQGAMGLKDAKNVFDWLYLNNVRRILRVIVVDNGENSHTDEVIINSLQRFKIETWDWRRMDLSADVIHQAAGSSVKRISLYFSGNLAVLNGWASADGFANKDRFPRLEALKVYYQRGLESQTRLAKSLDQFRTRVKKAFRGELEVSTQIQELAERIMNDLGDPPDDASVDHHNAKNGDVQRKEKPLLCNDPVDQATLERYLGYLVMQRWHEQNGQMQQIYPGENSSKREIIVELISEKKTNPDSAAQLIIREERSHAWIETMKNFAENFIMRLPEPIGDMYGPPVKIAVLDNGIDAALPIFHGKIAAGTSFAPYPYSRDLINAYFAPSDDHGTIMASLICTICPRVQLYVARLDEGSSVDGRRQITAKSAAAAVEWATNNNVDIISMSWTIEIFGEGAAGKPKMHQVSEEHDDMDDIGDLPERVQNESPDIKLLTKAIKVARDKNILLFASASDQGSASSRHCYPARAGGCITIGAATETGEMCAWVHPSQAKFCCPGVNVPFKKANETTPKPQSGSSVATALAAGLAGLLLFCDRALYKEKSILKSKKNMGTAFENLATGTDKQFPRVDDFFKKDLNTLDSWLVQDENGGLSDRGRVGLKTMMNKIIIAIGRILDNAPTAIMRFLCDVIAALSLSASLLPAPAIANPVAGQRQIPLVTADSKVHRTISADLYADFEELSRIVDITYCIGTPSPGISEPFICPSHCAAFPSFQLIQTWNTGPLMSDSCGYIALSHPPAEKRIIVAFRGTYSITNALVDLSTGRQEYVPYPPSNRTIPGGRPKDPDDPPKCEGCWAHAGFLESWKVAAEVVVPIVAKLVDRFGGHGYRLELVGHSLGGAVAALAGLEFRERGWDCRVTTFGEPKVGNANLSHYLNLFFPPPTYRRITHKSDPVPLLPFAKWGFVQHRTEYFIEKVDLPQAPEDVRICVGDEDEHCAAGGSANMVQILFSHRDYFNRLGLCLPTGWRRVLDGFWPPWPKDHGPVMVDQVIVDGEH